MALDERRPCRSTTEDLVAVLGWRRVDVEAGLKVARMRKLVIGSVRTGSTRNGNLTKTWDELTAITLTPKAVEMLRRARSS